MEFLSDIEIKSLEGYLKEKYQAITPHQKEKMFQDVEKEYEQHEEFFNGLSDEIDVIYRPSQLEHMMVVDFLGTVKNRKKLKEGGFIKPMELNRNGKLNKQMDKINGELDNDHYDGLTIKKQTKEDGKKQTDEKHYIASPFFKNFLKSVECDFGALGYKEKELADFYKLLDEKANVLHIPSLPDNLDDLI